MTPVRFDSGLRPTSRRTSGAQLLLGAIAIVACHELEFGLRDVACESAADCRQPYECIDGICSAPCESEDVDCGGGSENAGAASSGRGGVGVGGSSGGSSSGGSGLGPSGSGGAQTPQGGAGGASGAAGAGEATGGAIGGSSSGTGQAGASQTGGAATSGGSSGHGGSTGIPCVGTAGIEGGGASGAPGNACEGTLVYDELPLIPVSDVPISLVVTDVNGDGLSDLIVGSAEVNNISVRFGMGGGCFAVGAEYPTSGFRTVSLGDVNRDGHPDLVFATNGANVGVRMNEGDGSFARATYYPVGTQTMHVGLADLDRDDDVDLVVANLGSPELFVLPNEGEGTFAEAIGYDTSTDVGYRILVGNLNGDEYPDFIVLGGSTISVTVNLGTGDYTPTIFVRGGGLLSNGALADFNEDGSLDLAMSTRDALLSVFSGDGTGSFGEETQYPWGSYEDVAAADFDADGHVDVIATGTYNGDAQVMLNRFPDRNFSDFVTIPGQHAPLAVEVADLDGNGLPDLIFAYNNDDAIGVRLARCELEQ